MSEPVTVRLGVVSLPSGKIEEIDPREVTADRVGRFLAIHRSLEGSGGWVITHCPTGSAVCRTGTKAMARKVAVELDASADWSFDYRLAKGRKQKLARKALAKIVAEVMTKNGAWR